MADPLPGCSLRTHRVTGDGVQRAAQFTRIGRGWASDPYVARIASEVLRSKADDIERAELALRVVQALEYRPDPDSTDDSVREPCEIIGRGGDCDCLSALLVGILTALGLRAECVWLLQPLADQDHVAARVFVGREWLWCETTVKGAWLGEHPREAARRLRKGRAL